MLITVNICTDERTTKIFDLVHFNNTPPEFRMRATALQ